MTTDIYSLLKMLEDEGSDVPSFSHSKGIFMPAVSQGLGMVDRFGDIINNIRLKDLIADKSDINSPEVIQKLAKINPTVALSLKQKQSETKENTIKNLADNALLAYQKALDVDKLPEEQARGIAESIWSHGAQFKGISELPSNLSFDDLRGVSGVYGGLNKYGQQTGLEQLKSVLALRKIEQAKQAEIEKTRIGGEEARKTEVAKTVGQSVVSEKKHGYKMEELNTSRDINTNLEKLKSENEIKKQNLINERSGKDRAVKEAEIKTNENKIVYLQAKQKYVQEKEKDEVKKLPIQKQMKFDEHMLPIKELDGDLNEVDKLLNEANNLFNSSLPTEAAARLGTAYQIVAARLRTGIEHLGVPQAHDLEIVESTLRNPTQFLSTLKGGGLNNVRAQIKQLRRHMYISKQALMDTYGTPDSADPKAHTLTGEEEYAKEFLNEMRKEKAQASGKTQISTGFKNAKQEWIDHIISESKKLDVPPALAMAITSAESSWNPNAKSSVGAQGLMQLMDGTAMRFGTLNRLDPQQNISGGVRYLKFLMNKFKGNLPLVIAAYNAGEGAVEKYNNKVPPFDETQKYVPKVLAFYEHYKNKGYGG